MKPILLIKTSLSTQEQKEEITRKAINYLGKDYYVIVTDDEVELLIAKDLKKKTLMHFDDAYQSKFIQFVDKLFRFIGFYIYVITNGNKEIIKFKIGRL